MPAKPGHLALIALAIAVAAAFFPVTEAAFAQERQRFNIFRQIFAPRQPVERAQPPPRTIKKRAPRRAAARAARAAREPNAAPAEPAVEKLENARVVVVVGDFLAAGLAEGLTVVFEQSPGVRILDRTNGSSGLVRDDFYNWQEEIGPLIEAEKPTAVVVMIGSNDRQQMRMEGSREPVRSEIWNREYEARVRSLAKAIGNKGIPLVWVGLPAFKSTSMSSDMLAFNDIYQRAAERAEGVFVDIWDGFVDENGSFTTTGPDVNGQPVRLRAGDGINLTRPGKRKVAFYAEKPLNRILGNAVSPSAGTPSPGDPPEPNLDPEALPRIDRTAPVSLNDPELDGGTELLGATALPKHNGKLTPAERLAVEGISPAAKPGRADNFDWRRNGQRTE